MLATTTLPLCANIEHSLRIFYLEKEMVFIRICKYNFVTVL
jgi:hypothetical protein